MVSLGGNSITASRAGPAGPAPTPEPLRPQAAVCYGAMTVDDQAFALEDPDAAALRADVNRLTDELTKKRRWRPFRLLGAAHSL